MKQFFQQLQPSKLWKSDRAKCLAACLVHLPSLVTTIALISLNFSFKWYSDADIPNQNAQLNALQFASKVHEIVIIASLSVVAASCVQHELCRRDGLAIGGVLAAFQIPNILSLFDPALWRSTGFSPRRILFGLSITLFTLLGAVVGPSSAILMLPSVGLWDLNIPLTWSQGGIKDTTCGMFMTGHESAIWPSSITTSNFLPPQCRILNASSALQDRCPAAGLPVLLARPWMGSSYGDGFGTGQIFWNFSMSGNASVPLNDSPYPNSYQYNRGVQGALTLTDGYAMLTQSTASSVDSAMISVFAKARWSKPYNYGRRLNPYQHEWQWKENVDWRFSLKNGTRTLAPQTFVLCRTEPLLLDLASNLPLSEQSLVFPLRGEKNWSVDATSLSNKWNSTIPMVSGWLEPPDLHNNTPSIWFASIGSTKTFREYYNHTSHEFYTISAPEIVTCSIYASWRPVDVSLRPGTPFRLCSSAIDDGAEYFKSRGGFIPQGFDKDAPLWSWAHDNLTEPGLREIFLEADWANLALPPELTVDRLITNFGQKLQGHREKYNTALSIRELSTRTAVSFLITDALARFGSEREVIIATENPPEAEPTTVGYVAMQKTSTLDLPNLTPIQVTRDRYGYSYSTAGTTRRLAIAVMLIHISIALTHTVLVVRYKWWYPNLQSLSDFFVLAVNSSRPEPLGDCSSQVEVITKKRDYHIQVREVGDEELEMDIRGKDGLGILH